MRLVAFAVAAATLALLAGCPVPPGDTIVEMDEGEFEGGGGGGFPGGRVSSNNVAGDQRALSQNGHDFQQLSLTCVRNGATGQAIVTFRTEAGGAHHFWASYFDGSSFTQPVEIIGVDSDPSAPVEDGSVIVAFLNTAGFASSNDQAFNAAVQGRNGDAVILFKRRDATQDADAVTGNDDVRGPNVRLYYAYFDASFRTVSRRSEVVRGNAVEEVRRGFTVRATPVDTLDEGPTGDDPSAEDVQAFGVISDGLCGNAIWSTGASEYEWGDAVSHIVAFWAQTDDADDVGGDPNVENEGGLDNPFDTRLFTSTLNLGTAVFGLPAEGGLAGADGSSAGVDRDETSITGFRLYSHNNVGLNEYADVNGGLGQDIVLNAIVATVDPADGLPDLTAVEISPTHVATNDDVAEAIIAFAAPGERFDLAGGDDGLAGLFVFFVHESDTNNAAGDVDDQDLFVARIDDFGYTEATDLERISTDATDAAGGNDVGLFQARVNRTGEYVGLWYFQNAFIAEDADQNAAIRGAIVLDTIDDFAQGATGVSRTSLLSTHAGGGVLDNVLDASFQQDLGFFCGFQSDPNKMNIVFLQELDNDAAGDVDELRVAQLLNRNDAALDPRNGEVLVDDGFQNGEFGAELAFGFGAGARAIDAGANGEVLVVYTQDTQPTDPDGNRLFAAEVDASGSGNVDGNIVIGDDRDDEDDIALAALVGTPRPQSAVGAAAPARIDILWTAERRGSGTLELSHRAYDASQANAVNNVAFNNRFFPSIGAFSFGIDTHQHQDVTLLGGDRFALANGSTVSVAFAQSGHLYTNDFNGTRWIEENGAIRPQIIDNDDRGATNPSDIPIGSHDGEDRLLICTRTCTCDRLAGAIYFFAREEADGDLRLFARVRN